MSTVVICPVCGSKLRKIDEDKYIDTCSVCGSNFVVSIGQDLAINNIDGTKLLNLRKEIDFAITKVDESYERLLAYCKELLSINPYDFVVNYYYGYLLAIKKDKELLYEFLNMKYNRYTQEELDVVLKHLFKYSDVLDKMKIQKFIFCLENSEEINNQYLLELKKRYDKQKEKEQKEKDDLVTEYINSNINKEQYKNINLEDNREKKKNTYKIILIILLFVFGIIAVWLTIENITFSPAKENQTYTKGWLNILSIVLFVFDLLLLINIKEK